MNNKTPLCFNSHEELIFHLKNCVHWNSTEIDNYDFVGISLLLDALLDNLSSNTLPHEYEELRNIISNKSLEFLKNVTKD